MIHLPAEIWSFTRVPRISIPEQEIVGFVFLIIHNYIGVCISEGFKFHQFIYILYELYHPTSFHSLQRISLVGAHRFRQHLESHQHLVAMPAMLCTHVNNMDKPRRPELQKPCSLKKWMAEFSIWTFRSHIVCNFWEMEQLDSRMIMVSRCIFLGAIEATNVIYIYIYICIIYIYIYMYVHNIF